MTLGKSKDTKVESTGFQVDKNVIYYGNTAINTNNISLISVSPIPANNSWFGAVILGLVGIAAIKYGGWILLIAAVVWGAIVFNYNKNRGEFLTISLNSGNTLYFHCRDKTFLDKVVLLMVDCIKTGTESYTVNFDRCVVNKGIAGNMTVGV